MNDLFVYAADQDILAVMGAVLERHQQLGFRALKYMLDRHPHKDPGMVNTGHEMIRSTVTKNDCHKVVLLWDHRGSGREHRHASARVARDVQDRLDGITWQRASCCIALDPELEEWLWYDVPSIASHLGATAERMEGWIEAFCARHCVRRDVVFREKPSELFEYVCLDRARRTISPRDFSCIARSADLTRWLDSPSFSSVVAQLREWFP